MTYLYDLFVLLLNCSVECRQSILSGNVRISSCREESLQSNRSLSEILKRSFELLSGTLGCPFSLTRKPQCVLQSRHDSHRRQNQREPEKQHRSSGSRTRVRVGGVVVKHITLMLFAASLKAAQNSSVELGDKPPVVNSVSLRLVSTFRPRRIVAATSASSSKSIAGIILYHTMK